MTNYSLSLSLSLSLKPVLWFGSTRMGCANFRCPMLSVPGGNPPKLPNAYLVVCAYDPLYFMSDSGNLFTQSASGCNGRSGRCGENRNCLSFQSGGSLDDVNSASNGVASRALYCGKQIITDYNIRSRCSTVAGDLCYDNVTLPRIVWLISSNHSNS